MYQLLHVKMTSSIASKR